MKILYIGYWGANEGLSEATIYPHLEILSRHKQVEQITYASIEREYVSKFKVPKLKKLDHIPLRGNLTPFRFINKVVELYFFKKKLLKLSKKRRISLVICRTSLAGTFGLAIHRKLKIPFTVESFEPHADYMLARKVWRKRGLSYFFQRRSESSQKKKALMLNPVTYLYEKKLKNEGLDADRLMTMPCGVDIQKFEFQEHTRNKMRKSLGLHNSEVVGIYVGKFDGIYYSLQEIFPLFAASMDYFRSFKLILLTAYSKEKIEREAERHKFPISCLIIRQVHHNEVPDYLSASDFAYSLHYPTHGMAYVSPIKNGEYMANGLPILISEKIGDDAELIMQLNSGVTFTDIQKVDFNHLKSIIVERKHRQRIARKAAKYRSLKRSEEAYEVLLSKMS